MSQNQFVKTGIYVGVAGVLAILAAFVIPTERAPATFKDQGQAFFKTFSPLDIGAVDITSFDEQQGQSRPFRVEFTGGKWTIPSAQNYAADVKDRLGRVTALFVDLKKGDLRSDRESDFESLGVIDPRDENRAGNKGRGKRVTVYDLSGKALADLVVGNQVEGKYRFYYVREPGAKRVYACQIDASGLSTRFADWVETDLLKLGSAQVRKIVFDGYKLRVERRGARVEPGDVITVNRGADSVWSMDNLPAGAELDKEKLDSAQSTLSALTLVGVRRKPAGIMDMIRKIEEAMDREKRTGQAIPDELSDQMMDHFKQMVACGYVPGMSEKGKFSIHSNEGEVRVACDDGVVYTLRMGGVVMGEPDDLAGAATTRPAKGEPATKPAGREHRYLFITVDFDETALGAKPALPTTQPSTRPSTLPANAAATQPTTQPIDPAQMAEYKQKLADYEKKLADGKKRCGELEKKFDQWYYIVSAEAYAKLKLDRNAIIKKPVSPIQGPPAPETRPETTPPAAPSSVPSVPAPVAPPATGPATRP